MPARITTPIILLNTGQTFSSKEEVFERLGIRLENRTIHEHRQVMNIQTTEYYIFCYADAIPENKDQLLMDARKWQLYCPELQRIYANISMVCKLYGLTQSGILTACAKNSTYGVHPDNGTPLHWHLLIPEIPSRVSPRDTNIIMYGISNRSTPLELADKFGVSLSYIGTLIGTLLPLADKELAVKARTLIKHKDFSRTRVVLLNNGKAYHSIRYVAQQFNIPATDIDRCCRGLIPSVGYSTEENYTWAYERDILDGVISDSDIQERLILANQEQIYSPSLKQYFKDVETASKELRVTQEAIKFVCTGLFKHLQTKEHKNVTLQYVNKNIELSNIYTEEDISKYTALIEKAYIERYTMKEAIENFKLPKYKIVAFVQYLKQTNTPLYLKIVRDTILLNS